MIERERGDSSALGEGGQGKEGWGRPYVLPCVREERKREGSYLDSHQCLGEREREDGYK